MVCDTSAIKRSDLTLRCRYIGLETEIYQIDKNRYAIYCKNYKGNFAKLCAEFNDSIRQMGTWVNLTQESPKDYLRIIEPISLSNVVDGFKGAYITQPDIENAIIDRFPDVDIHRIYIKSGIGFSITIEVALGTSQETMSEMETVLSAIDFGTDQVNVRYISDKSGKSNEPFVPTYNFMQLGINKRLPFTIDEADYWFANAEKIYSGQITRDSLPKIYSQTASCCLDCSMHNPVNIRSVLLLYSTVYLILPLADRFGTFLAEQNLSRNELLDLARMGKVTFVLNNLENRYDQQFLLEAYRCNPLSVIGRRGINTVVASFLSETRERFLSHFPAATESALAVRELAENSEDPFMHAMEHVLSWPIVEPARSFDQLNSSGPLSLGTMDFDLILLPLLDQGNQRISNQMALLLQLVGNNVFLSSAFNATLFPGEIVGAAPFNQGFHTVSSIMSDLLQVYWYNTEAIKNIEFIRGQSFGENQTISLFDCKQNISAVKVAELADQYQTFDGFKRIIDNLGMMSETEQKSKIRLYNDTLFDLASTRQTTSKIDFMLSTSSFFPLPYSFSLVAAIASMAKGKIGDVDFMRERAELKRIEACLKATGRPQTSEFVEDIYILDKISRVAGLR